ncbi:MAG: DUF4249 domain-containing protein [Chitinophagaceae bacterium]|nr:DUF4249 domain-containing protein [Chitinophagaceae bacterium]
MIKINSNIIFCLPLAIALIFASGCKKIIELKTNEIPPRFVIEANLSDQLGDCYVYISQTVRLSDSSNFSGVSGAKVTISDSGHNTVALFETFKGFYRAPSLRAITNHHYILEVEINGQHFSGEASLHRKVPFDSLYISDYFIFGKNRKFANVIFQDPPGKGDSYRFLQYKNNAQNANIFVMNDEFSDGRKINTFLAYFDQNDEEDMMPGDSITVEMQCIDPKVYTYFNSLAQSATGGNDAVTPGNPVSNITGGALGYFNVYTKERKSVVVK